jgi:hypothetical protein
VRLNGARCAYRQNLLSPDKRRAPWCDPDAAFRRLLAPKGVGLNWRRNQPTALRGGLHPEFELGRLDISVVVDIVAKPKKGAANFWIGNSAVVWPCWIVLPGKTAWLGSTVSLLLAPMQPSGARSIVPGDGCYIIICKGDCVSHIRSSKLKMRGPIQIVEIRTQNGFALRIPNLMWWATFQI